MGLQDRRKSILRKAFVNKRFEMDFEEEIMCTSFVINKGKTLVGWNLDILDMIHRVRATDDGVYIR